MGQTSEEMSMAGSSFFLLLINLFSERWFAICMYSRAPIRSRRTPQIIDPLIPPSIFWKKVPAPVAVL